jgi:drug/metabolite transporter (DMT)-like permease
LPRPSQLQLSPRVGLANGLTALAAMPRFSHSRMGTRHATTGRWTLGLGLALVTTAAWSTLPAALKASLEYIDAYTLTWFRFLVATLVMALWVRGRTLARTNYRDSFWLLLVAAVMLTADYVLYLLGLDLTTPAIAQVVIQSALVLTALGGVWFFGEHFSKAQWIGFTALMAGLAIFFHRQLAAFASEAGRLWMGSVLIVAAGITWAVYALVQKQLLTKFSSDRIMLFIYAFATVSLLPMAAPARLGDLSLTAWLVVSYCALNTLVAYGAFAEAMDHWAASRISAVLALTPLGTIAFAEVLEHVYPEAAPTERLDGLSLVGAAVVVAGSMVASLAGDRANPAQHERS